MTSYLDIVSNIEKIVLGDYRRWTIGITEAPDRRKEEHNYPERWFEWLADSEQDARNMEKYFLDKGMNGAGGGGDKPTYVYIFQWE